MKLISVVLATWIYPLLVLSHEEDYDNWVNEMMYEFTGIGNDLTKVTWVHAVNSQAEMKKALKGDAMFLEADVSIGKYIGDSKEDMPIMAHPPNTTSDLTLEQFLEETLKSEKHIKLDFKSRMAFSASEPIVTEALLKHSYAKRIWLNADIIPGPINCTKEVVDADYFLSACVAKFPDAVISAGWSTCYSPKNSNGGYTHEQIEVMADALNRNMVIGTVTFPVRAGLAAQSYQQLTTLMRTSLPETTLTIWSSPGDPVDVPKLIKLIDAVGRDRIFIDVPQDLYDKIIHGQIERSEEMSSAVTVTSIISLTLTSLLVLNIF